jgi:hypothetical protein
MKFITVLLTALMLSVSSLANAGLIVDLVGDKDCFGTNLVCTEGASILGASAGLSDPYWQDNNGAYVDITYNHLYDLNGESASSASLEILSTYLADFRGPWDVFFNNSLIGQFATVNANIVVKHTFNIDTSLLTGNDTVFLKINSPTRNDGYWLDYAELTISTTSSSIPEPSTLAIFALGMIGLASRRFKKLS